MSTTPSLSQADLGAVLDRLQQRNMLGMQTALSLRDVPHPTTPHRRRVLVLENGAPRLFLKLAANREDAESLLAEFQSLVLVRTVHANTTLLANLPNPVFMGEVDGLWCLAQLAVPGEPLNDRLYPGGLALMRRLKASAFLKVLPSVLAHLHRPLRTNTVPVAITPPPGLSTAAQECLNTSLVAHLQHPGPMGGTHGAFSPENLLHTRDHACFVDWETYDKTGTQVFDLFHLFTHAAFGNRRHLNADAPPPKAIALSPGRVAQWLLRPGPYHQLFVWGLETYATQMDARAGDLGPLYGAYLATMYWQSAEREGPGAPRTREWAVLLEQWAACRGTFLNPLAA